MTRRHSSAFITGIKFCLFILFVAMVTLETSYAVDRRGRLGAGISNQLLLDNVPSVSFKLQTARTTSVGLMFALDTDDDGGLGSGLKISQNFFEEPQLVFYGAFLGAFLNDKRLVGEDQSGFQFDFTLGSEFSFSGLKSLGFHFEFGVSLNKLEKFRVQTVGSQLLVMGIHFYL